MRTTIIFTLMLLCSCSDPMDALNDSLKGMRPGFVAINADLQRLLGDRAVLVNVGPHENCGCGDKIGDALQKIDADLKILAKNSDQQR